MTELAEVQAGYNNVTLLKLAREIAMDMRPIDEILKIYKLEKPVWDTISRLPAFQELLRTAVEEWQSATNTQERVKLKSLAFVEEALPEFYARAHDPDEPLSAKTDVLKTVAKFAGVDRSGFEAGGGTGERMVVTINLGADHQLKIEKEITSKVIEGEYE